MFQAHVHLFLNPFQSVKHPWMTALVKRDDDNKFLMKCGATLISSKYVLTAGHCVETGDLTDFKVYLNESDYPNQADEPGRIELTLKNILFHPNYEIRGKSLYYDLAVLELNEEVPLSNKVFPICLPNESHDLEIRNNRAATIFSYATSSKTEVYMNVKSTAFQTNENCDRLFNRRSQKVRNFFNESLPKGFDHSITCTDSKHSTQSGICRGDGGSPVLLIDDENDRFVQLGIVVATIPWVFQRCSYEWPAVHIRLTHPDVMSFIRHAMTS